MGKHDLYGKGLNRFCIVIKCESTVLGLTNKPNAECFIAIILKSIAIKYFWTLSFALLFCRTERDWFHICFFLKFHFFVTWHEQKVNSLMWLLLRLSCEQKLKLVHWCIVPLDCWVNESINVFESTDDSQPYLENLKNPTSLWLGSLQITTVYLSPLASISDNVFSN